MKAVIGKLESKLPEHIRDGVEMVIVGQFDEFQERADINAFYKDGALYVSNFQSDNADLLDDLGSRDSTLCGRAVWHGYIRRPRNQRRILEEENAYLQCALEYGLSSRSEADVFRNRIRSRF